MSFFPIFHIFVHALTLNLSSYPLCPFCSWKSTGGYSHFIPASLWHSYSSHIFPALVSVLPDATAPWGNVHLTHHGVLSKHYKAIFALSPGVPPSSLTLGYAGCYCCLPMFFPPLTMWHFLPFLTYVFPKVPHLELVGSVILFTGSVTEVSGISCVQHRAVLASPYRDLSCSSSLPKPLHWAPESRQCTKPWNFFIFNPFK